MGAAGGKVSRGGGFAQNRELAKEVGRLGGLASRRTADSDKVVQCNYCYRRYVSTASRNSHVSRKHSTIGA